MAHRVLVSSRGPLRRPKSSSETVTSTVSKPQCTAVYNQNGRVLELEKKMLSFCEAGYDEKTIYQDLLNTCIALIQDPKNVDWLFQVFCLSSWIDRYRSPIISKLFYKLTANDNNNGTSSSSMLLCKLESAYKDVLQVLTLLGTPNAMHFSVVFLLCSTSHLKTLPSSHRAEVLCYLEELTRAFWPYCMSNTRAPSLWNSDAFVDSLCDVLIACGQSMEVQCPVNMNRTFQMISTQLISNTISQYSRLRLLEILELRSLGWEMEHTAKEYYKSANEKVSNSVPSLLCISLKP